MLGPLLALASAALFGLNSASARRAVLTGTSLQGLAISVPIGVPIFLAAAGVSGAFGIVAGFSATQVGLLLLAGCNHFVFGRYCNYRCVRALGANIAGPVVQTSLLLSLALAVWLLDETLTPLKILGIVLIVGGPILILRGRRQNRPQVSPSDHPRFEPQYGEGYLYAILNALAFGTSPILLKLALDGTGPAGGVAGGIIAYGIAAIVVFLVVVTSASRIREVTGMSRTTAKWFTLSGVFVCLSQMLRFMSLTVAPVTVVAPIQQTSGAFRVVFAWFINREHEIFSLWVLVGIVLALAGAFALSLSTELVLARLNLPETWEAAIRWTWP